MLTCLTRKETAEVVLAMRQRAVRLQEIADEILPTCKKAPVYREKALQLRTLADLLSDASSVSFTNSTRREQ